MCCVMPPASPLTTFVWRMASRSDVLPWSTWPMIVTTGGGSARVLLVVLERRLVVLGVAGADDLDLLVERLGEDADRLVGERLGERDHLAHAHELLDDLGHRDAEVLGDVLDRRARVDADDVGPRRRLLIQRRGLLGQDVAAAAPPSPGPLLRASGSAAGAAGTAGTAARGLRVDDDAAGPAAGAALGAHPAAVRAPARGGRLRLGLVARRALLGLRRGDDLRAGAGGGRALGRRDDGRAAALAAPRGARRLGGLGGGRRGGARGRGLRGRRSLGGRRRRRRRLCGRRLCGHLRRGRLGG